MPLPPVLYGDVLVSVLDCQTVGLRNTWYVAKAAIDIVQLSVSGRASCRTHAEPQ